MRHRRIAWSVVIVSILASGCGSSESEQHVAAASATSSVTTGTGGSGGVGGGGAGAGAGGSGAGGSAPACADPFIEIVGHGPDQRLTNTCPGGGSTSGPTGVFSVDPLSGAAGIGVTGCAETGKPRIDLGAKLKGPGTDPTGSLFYVDADGTYYDYVPPGATVTIASFGPVGGTIEGSYSSKVVPAAGGAELSLSGGFRVCRMPDHHGGD